MHAATSKVENSAQSSSCQLKFVYGSMHRSLWIQVAHSSFIDRLHTTKNTASGYITYLHSLNKFCDSSPALDMLLEQGGTAQVTAPDVVDGHRCLQLFHQLFKNMLVLKFFQKNTKFVKQYNSLTQNLQDKLPFPPLQLPII